MTRNYLSILFLFTAFTHLFAQAKKETVDIEKLIQSMSIEEKAGQMTQIDLGVIAEGEICNLKQPQQLNNDKLKTAILTYSIGSVLNVGCGSGTISQANWHTIISTLQESNKKQSRLKIPILYGIDAIHGANYTMGSTLFPQQIGQAATWNPELVKKAHQITAYETRASGIPWNFSPVLDLGRQPLWSRYFETFGEDVLLAKTMAKYAISGLQGDDVSSPYHVAACMKHFLGYSMPLSGKDRTPAWISDRELREYFLPSFKAAIDQGAKTIMINSGEINGTPVHVNYDLLTKLLREELGFKGIAVTDWEDIYKLVNLHHVAANKKEAVKMAILAGIDMSMTPNDYEFTKLLVELVKEGSITEDRINASVRRILEVKKQLGLFENYSYPIKNYPQFGSAEHAEVSYQAAAESITLLKNNNNLLPLKTDAKEKILVCGPAANSLNLLNGAWTHTWQGIDEAHNTPNKLSILEGIRKTKHSAEILFDEGSRIDSVSDLKNCLNLAAQADKIIVCLGETPCTEMPGNINNLELSEAQQTLIQKLKALKKPLVVVCCFNRPRIIRSVVPMADALLYAYLPGDEGGRAIADCLFGKINPSGKLPFSYPSDVNNIVHYDHKATEDLDVDFSMNAYRPQFDFGFGMSYTTFAYNNFLLSKNEISKNDSLIVSVELSNTGNREGKEVVELYYTDKVASITPSVKKLLAFQKISLSPGEKRKVEITVHAQDLSFINKNLERVTEPGEFELQLNNQKKILNVNN